MFKCLRLPEWVICLLWFSLSWPDVVEQATFGVPFLTSSLMWGWAVLSWGGLPSHLGCCRMPPQTWVRRQVVSCPRAAYIQVCDYDCHWSPSPVTLPCSYHHRSWGKKKNAGWQVTQIKPVWDFLKWGSHCTGTIPLSQPQKSEFSGMVSHYEWRLHWLQWMARSSLVLWHVICTPQCIAELPFWPLNLVADFLCLIGQNSLHMLGWAKPSSRRILRPTGSSHLV